MIVDILIFLVVVGFVLWAINTYVPMQEGIKTLMNAAVVIIVLIWLLKFSGALAVVSRPIR